MARLMTMQELLDVTIQWSATFAPKLIGAIVVLVVGFWITGILVRVMKKTMNKRVGKPLAGFLLSIVRISLRVLVVITAISMLGIEMTSFVALIGAAGLAVGLALQGSLQNFAGGVLILLFKPFTVGHFIEAQGQKGVVKEIQIFSTILTTKDNKQVILPNGALANASIVNYSAEKTRRVDMVFGIGYDSNMKKAKTILQEIATKHPKILQKPEPFIRMGNLGDSSVDISVRVWTKTENYWDVYFDVHETVKTAFDKHKISIPYPHQEVYMHNVR